MEDTSLGGNTGGPSSVGSTAPTFADAFQAAPVDSPSAEPATQDTTSPDTATPGSEPAAPPPQDDRSPFIPRARFDEVISARQKAEREFAEYKQQTGWAENQVLREAAQRIAAHAGNPMGLLQEIVQDLAQTPEGSQQLRSFLGQQFGGLRQRPQQPPAPTPPEPDVQITDGNGNVVGRTYSADALAQRDAIRDQQLIDKITQQLAPKLQTLDTIEAERQTAVATAKAETFAKSFHQELSALPGFAEHAAAIAADLQAMRFPDGAHPSEVNAATYRAYLKHALPHLGAKAQSTLLDSLQQKAKASTAVNPASAAPTSTGSIRSFTDPALTW